MTHPSKIKGNSFEREIVQKLRDSNIAARRVPLSGAAIDFKGDLMIPVAGLEYQSECKRRRRAFFSLDRWLGANRFLFIRDDRSRPMVVMDMDMFIALLKGRMYGPIERNHLDPREGGDATEPSTAEIVTRTECRYTHGNMGHSDHKEHDCRQEDEIGDVRRQEDRTTDSDWLEWPFAKK